MAEVALSALSGLAAVVEEVAAIVARRQDGDFDRWEKSGGEPVSDMDLLADRLLKERLAALDGQAGWLSEETADDPARLSAERVWVVDPIDGTRDYLRGRPGWCVSVALVEAGRPVLGVLAAPARGELWTAGRGVGAWRNGDPVRCSDRVDWAGARMPIDALPKGSELAKVAKPNSIALRMAMVAAGEADVLLTKRWGNEWDVAAAALLVKEAGGLVTDAAGEALRFNQGEPGAFGLAASGPGLHARAIAQVSG